MNRSRFESTAAGAVERYRLRLYRIQQKVNILSSRIEHFSVDNTARKFQSPGGCQVSKLSPSEIEERKLVRTGHGEAKSVRVMLCLIPEHGPTRLRSFDERF